MLLAIVAAVVACLLSLVGVLLLRSRGKPRPLVDENGNPLPGSISAKLHVNINGVEQGMFITGKDQGNPVLLFLHGGPGMPEYFLTQSYHTGLEACFTVCWWEQRGAGLSYSASIPPATMTAEQFIADTLGVTAYLRQRFGKEKIYLMAHSGGSFIGIQAAARAPDLYHAYIGVAQIAYQLKSESLAYAYMLKRFKENGNVRMVRRLEQAPVTMTVPLPDSYLSLRDEAMHSLGIGTMHGMKSVVTGIFLPVWTCRAYTVGEKVAIWRGKAFSRSLLWDKMIATDLTKQVTVLGLPTYFLHGVYDYTASYTEARSYFDGIDAPVKGFYTFEHAAHSPIFEEPEKVLTILREDVLAGANSLADAT
jgi:pimeloyl-ACP methyl ester carboxylesterase